MSEICALVLIKPNSPDHVAELEQIFEQLVDGVRRKDRGVPTYAYFIGEDGVYRVIERYESSTAYLEHLAKMDRSLVARMVEIAEFSEVEILGDPTPEARREIAEFSPLYRLPVTAL